MRTTPLIQTIMKATRLLHRCSLILYRPRSLTTMQLSGQTSPSPRRPGGREWSRREAQAGRRDPHSSDFVLVEPAHLVQDAVARSLLARRLVVAHDGADGPRLLVARAVARARVLAASYESADSCAPTRHTILQQAACHVMDPMCMTHFPRQVPGLGCSRPRPACLLLAVVLAASTEPCARACGLGMGGVVEPALLT